MSYLAFAVYCSEYGFHVINVGIDFNNAFISFVDFYYNLFNYEGFSIIITRLQFYVLKYLQILARFSFNFTTEICAKIHLVFIIVPI